MTPPTEFKELVTDYELDWDRPGDTGCDHDECREASEQFVKEGEHYEHAFVHMENGYTVSLLRMNKALGDDEAMVTLGFEDGLWEASIGVESNAIIKAVLGLEYMPISNPTELGFDEDGRLGHLDNAAINALLGRVAALPAPENSVPTEDLGGLF